MIQVKRGPRAFLHSIRVRLPAGIMLCVLTMVILLVYAATTSQRFLNDSIGEGTALLTTELLTRINQELFLRLETIQVQARDFQVQAVLAEANAAGQGREAPRSRPGASLRDLADSPLSRNWREKFVDFHKIKYGYAVIEEILLTDRNGTVVAQTQAPGEHRFDGQQWWQAARRDGLFFSGSEPERGIETYAIGICLRVDDLEGRFAGVLRARVNISAIIHNAEIAVRWHETTVIRMLTAEGQVIYSTKPFHLLEKLGETEYLRAMTGAEGYFSVRRGAKRIFVSYARSDTFSNLNWLGWTLVTEHDLREVSGPSLKLNSRILVSSLLFVAMSLLLAFVLSRSIVAPLSRLSQAVEKVGEGDFRQWVRIERADEIGHLARAFTTMIDKRRDAEAALAAEKAYSESIIETANALVLTLSADGTILSFNRFAERLTGYARAEVIGRNWFQLFIEPSQRGELESLQRRILSTPSVVHGRNNNILTKQGERIPVDWSNSILLGAPGGEPVTLSVGIDLSERSRAEAALHEAEAKYRSAMESMADLVYICSPDYRVEYMNRAMIDWLGRDATGERCYQAIHNQKEKCQNCKWETILSGKSHTSEIVSPKDNRSFHATHTPLAHQDGTISQMTVYRDTTSLKKIESQLRQAQKMESLGILAGGIAHDFNNMLAPILGYAELLLETLPQDSSAREGLSAIHQAGQRAKEMVQQILTFSRQRSFEMKPTRLQDILQEALKLARSSLPSTIAIRQDIDPDCPRVMADATQMHQVAMNLITNAYHAMEEKGGALTVALRQIELDPEQSAHLEIGHGLHVCLTVSDTGVGMDQRVRDSLFDPYFTTKEEGKGSGLGLAVVHGIVKSHGGRISVYSEQGKGTKFQVYLPALAAAAEVQPPPPASALQKGSEAILLVDDQRQVLATERSMLERLGYRVSVCGGGAEALEAFRASPGAYDLVITDLTMPNLTGEQLAGEIHKLRPDLPIVLCTGFGERLSQDILNALGIRACLLKPVSLKELSAKLRGILDNQRPPPAAPN